MTKAKILIVDDHQENILALRSLIEADDIEIITALNADEALNLIVAHDFALALFDVQMPGVSGFELARLIRGVKKFRRLPFIFVTAQQRSASVVFEGYDTGAVDLLFKPLDPHVVRSKVRVFVELHRQNRLVKEQVAELERLKQRAEAANIAKTQFLANMSHEIRTPLAAVIGFADLLTKDEFSAEEKQEGIAAIHRNGKHLLRLIDDILDISKIEAHRLDIDKVEFDFNDLLRDVEAALSLKAEEKGVTLEIRNAANTIRGTYLGDPARIKQVLWNVIGNGIKFTSRGKVEVLVEQRDKFLCFRVTDSGVGLSAQQVDRLFMPFSQADASTKRQFGGTGLGLIIARQLAQAMGGNVQLATTALGHGSTFVITLEVEKVSDGSTKKPTAKDSSYEFTGRKILVVDDSIDNRVLMELFLKSTGVNLQLAASGAEAINAVKADAPDLILMDLQMPNIDGYEATAKIRKMGFKKPIIAFTAHAMQEHETRCREAGCNSILTKPINREDLLRSLNEYLARQPEMA